MVFVRAMVIGLGVGSLLACGGLKFSVPDIEDVGREQALDAGYDVPPGAEHIYGSWLEDLDRSATYVRFILPPEAVEPLVESYRANALYTEHSSWDVPRSWPDFDRHEAPLSWWQPTGTVAFRTSQSADMDGGGSTMGSGALVAIDVDTQTVFHWQWEWQWWSP